MKFIVIRKNFILVVYFEIYFGNNLAYLIYAVATILVCTEVIYVVSIELPLWFVSKQELITILHKALVWRNWRIIPITIIASCGNGRHNISKM